MPERKSGRPSPLGSAHLKEMRHFKEFQAPLSTAFDAILTRMDQKEPENDAEVRLDAARIINCILAEKKDRIINGGDVSAICDLMPQAQEMGSAIFSENPTAREKIEALQGKIKNLGFLNREIIESRNEKKVRAFTLEAVNRAFKNLKGLVPKGKPFVLLAIADGATAPALALIELLKEQPDYEDVVLEILPFNAHGDNPDQIPVASDEDIKRYKDYVEEGRVIVVYNDHEETGITKRKTIEWIEKEIIGDNQDFARPLGLTNDPEFETRRSRALFAAQAINITRERGGSGGGAFLRRRLKI